MIAILGSGLSGLLAAKALDDCGVSDFAIISDKPDSAFDMKKGFLLLYDNFGLEVEDAIISVKQMGSEEVYKEKLGYDLDIKSSWKKGLEEYWIHGWNPYHVAHKLYLNYYE